MKSIIVAFIGLLSALYLVYPSLGIFELIPDNIPFIGNLDEASASALLFASLRYFGIDITSLFRREKDAKDVKDVSKKN